MPNPITTGTDVIATTPSMFVWRHPEPDAIEEQQQQQGQDHRHAGPDDRVLERVMRPSRPEPDKVRERGGDPKRHDHERED